MQLKYINWEALLFDKDTIIYLSNTYNMSFSHQGEAKDKVRAITEAKKLQF